MTEVLREFTELFFDDECNLYVVRAYGEETSTGDWVAWVGFHGNGENWLTLPATVRQTREALETWASGVTQAWLDRALASAKLATMRNHELLVYGRNRGHEAPAPVC